MAIFKKIRDILQGDVSQAGYDEGEREAFVADSFAMGVEQEMKESSEKGGTEDINIGVGELQEASIAKSMDAATETGDDAGIQAPDGDSDPAHMQVHLENAQISSYQLGVTGDDPPPTEELALNYTKVKWTPVSQDDEAPDDWETNPDGDAAAMARDKWVEIDSLGQSIHKPGGGASAGDGSVVPGDQLGATPEEPAAEAQGTYDTHELEQVSFTYQRIDHESGEGDLGLSAAQPGGDVFTPADGPGDSDPTPAGAAGPDLAVEPSGDQAGVADYGGSRGTYLKFELEKVDDDGLDDLTQDSESAAFGDITLKKGYVNTTYDWDKGDEDTGPAALSGLGETEGGEMTRLGSGPDLGSDVLDYDGIDGEADADELDV